MILLHTVNPEDPPQIVNSNKLNKVAGHRSNTQNRLCLYSNTKQLEKKAKKKGGFPGSPVVKNLFWNARDSGLIPHPGSI